MARLRHSQIEGHGNPHVIGQIGRDRMFLPTGKDQDISLAWRDGHYALGHLRLVLQIQKAAPVGGRGTLTRIEELDHAVVFARDLERDDALLAPTLN